MSANSDRIIELFSQAKAQKSLVERDNFLAEACRGEPELLKQVDSLLRAGEAAGGFLGNTMVLPPSDPLTEKPGDHVGRYKLLEKLGEGGFGAVWAAEQKEPIRRRVALKIIKLGMDTRQVVARFEAERQALALMDHPNIAKVLDAGATETGRPYFVMELVRGIKITEYCDQTHLGTRERLDLFIKVCHAIQHAHQKGIIHRDLKPSNILVTLHDGVPVPKVIDFGIAKATQQELTEKTIYTQFQQFIGTPAYMSPEQAEMSGLDLDTRSDIYSLGVLLYELLTGQTPFDAEELLAAGLDEMRRIIREKEPVRPSTRLTQNLVAADVRRLTLKSEIRNPKSEIDGASTRRLLQEKKEFINAIRGDLDWIVMKCLEKDRTRRYETANALAADLQRHLGNEPVVARPPSAAYRLRKLVRRNKLAFATLSLVVAALILGLAVATVAWSRERAARAQAEVRRQEAAQARLAEGEQRRQAEANLYAADMILAGLALQDNDLGKARALLARHEPGDKSKIQNPKSETSQSGSLSTLNSQLSTDLRAWEWRYIRGQCASDELFTLDGHSLSAGVAFVSTNLLVSGSSDGTIRLWDIAARQEVRALHHGSPLQMFRVSPDGRLLVANDENAKKMFIWDRETFGLVYSTRSATDAGGRADFLPDGRTLFFFKNHRSIARLTLGPGAPREEVWMATTPQGNLACSPDGQFIAVTGNDLIEIQNLKSDSALAVQHPDGPSVLVGARAACFSPDSRYLALRHQQTVHLVDAQTGRWLRSHQHHEKVVSGVVFSPDGHLLISAGHDQAIWFQDIDTWTAVARYRGHLDQIHSLAVSPDGHLLATGAKDGSIKLWDALPPVQKDALHEVLNRASRVHFTRDSKQFVTVDGTGGESEIKVWHTATASMTDRFAVEGDRVLDAMLLSGQKIALVREDERVEIWDLASHRRTSLLVPAPDKPQLGWALRLILPRLFDVEDGGTLICIQDISAVGTFTALEERGPMSVHVCDLLTMKPTRSWRFPFAFGVTAGGFSPDGKLLAIGGHDGELAVLSLEDGRMVKMIRAHGKAIMNKIEFLTGQSLMATVGMDGYLQLWDTDKWERRHRLRADPNQLYSVAFHPDGTRVVTGAQGNMPLTLWDVASGRELARLQSPLTNKVNRLLFINHDTLVGWTGQQVPQLNDKVVTWKAPSFADIEAVESLKAIRNRQN